MSDERCPRCQWPLAELLRDASSHPVADGRLEYQRCVCGAWLLVVNGVLAAATRTPRIAS